MTVLYWTTHEGFESDNQEAPDTSFASDGALMVVIFKGQTTTGIPYKRVLRLPLSTTPTEAAGEYSSTGDDSAFKLIGAFKDEEFTRYEGTWSEPGYVATWLLSRSTEQLDVRPRKRPSSTIRPPRAGSGIERVGAVPIGRERCNY